MLAVLGLAVVGATLHAGVAAARPVANFDYTPKAPITHQTLKFVASSTTTPPDTIVSQTWDFDDDDVYDDASGETATWTFTRPGPHIVGLEVTDTNPLDPIDHKRIRIVIGNRTPVPSMVALPTAPAAGQQVTFLSNSYDPDGFIASYAWDLDDDGAFDDGTGSSVSAVFGAGRHTVGLRVVDDSGDSAATTGLLDVGVVGGSLSSFSGPLLSPFPIVRVSGIVRRRGIKIRVLSVSAPVGSTVHVRCGGRGCPFKKTSADVKGSATSPQAPLVQIKRFRGRLLRIGATIRVFVTKAGAIGKYTRFRIRKGKPPARVDRCVTSVKNEPFACP
jgi:hypothetical protein